MQSILLPTCCSGSDAYVLETAFAVAKLVSGHLNFLHIKIGSGEAALNTPHMAFAMGRGLATAMQELDTESEERSAGAARHVHDFCARSMIRIIEKPGGEAGVTATLQEEVGYAYHRLLARARRHDLVVMGRAARPNGLPPDLVEELLLRCGRPLLLASPNVPTDLISTVMVGWRDT